MRPVLVFFAIFVPLTVAVQYWVAQAGLNAASASALMWSVGVSALAALAIAQRSLRGVGWKLGPLKFLLIAYALPAAYGAVSYGIAAAAGLAGFLEPERLEHYATAVIEGEGFSAAGLATTLALVLSVNFIVGLIFAAGEEIGWRGLLTPRLTAAWGFLAATLVTGAIWAVWHFPVLFFSGYHGEGVRWAEAASFFVMVVAISGPFAWLRLASGSVWPAVMLHAAHNMFLQSVFDPLSTRGASDYTMVGEFGVVTALTCVVVSAPFWILGLKAAKSAAA